MRIIASCRRGLGRRGLPALVTALALICCGAGSFAALDVEGLRGRPLVSVLQELRDQGLDLIFSSAVVSDDLVVSVDPASRKPREVLDEILEPLGLRAEDGPGGSILVLPGLRAKGRVGGRVLEHGEDAPIAGASVALDPAGLEAETGPDGSFEIPGVPPGTYELTVRAARFSSASVSDVSVPRGADVRFTVRMRPRPTFSTEVVVTPGRHSLMQERTESSRTIDQSDKLLVPNIGGDISRVVERLPGIAAADNSAAFHTRGSLALDTSFVLDGLELYDPFHLQSFQSPFSLIDSQVVDQVEFLGGGFTAEYGDRHGAFIEVSTVTPGEKGEGEIEVGTLNSRVSYGAPLEGGAGSWLVSARGWYPESLLDTLEQGGADKIRPRFGDVYAKLAWSISPRSLLSFHGLFAYDELSYQEQGEEDNENVEATTKSGYVWTRLLKSWSPRISSDTALSAGRINRSREGVAAPDDGPLDVVDDRDVEFIGLTHDMSWQLSDAHLLKGGLYARDLRAEYLYINRPHDDPGASSRIELEPDGKSVGLYAAYRTRISSDFATEFGVRWDRQDYTDDNQLSPRLNLLWRVSERSDLRFAVGRYQQSQRIHELRVEDDETEFLPAEISSQTEFTFQHSFGGGWRFRLDAYYRRLTELRPRWENMFQPIDLFPETSEERIEIAPDEARLRGIELLWSEEANRSLTWWFSYTYSRAEDLIDGSYVPRSWDQPHAAKFLVGYRREDRWFLSLSGGAHTGWPTTPVSSGVATTGPDGSVTIEPEFGETNSSRFPTYARLDLKARRSFQFSGSRLSLTLDIVNLTNRDNVCCVDDVLFELLDDGTVVADPEYAYWLGFTPIFSVLWEF